MRDPVRRAAQTGFTSNLQTAQVTNATDSSGKTTLTAQDARGGKELGVMRYVLHISLALAVIAGIVVYAIFFH